MSKKDENSVWSKFDDILKAEKFKELKINGFEVSEVQLTKNYALKELTVEFDLIYDVNDSWGTYRHYTCIYTEENLESLRDDIVRLKNQCKTTKAFSSNLKKTTVRSGRFKAAGWIVYYRS